MTLIQIQRALAIATPEQLASALASRPRSPGGGRKPTCACGKCRKCKNRERMARVRASS